MVRFETNGGSFAKELKVVEEKMNKDRGLINKGGERDHISAMAAKLVCELPRIQGGVAGTGSELAAGYGRRGVAIDCRTSGKVPLAASAIHGISC